MLSSLCKNIADKDGIKVGDVKKLVLNLGNKSNYILHYKYLQLYLLLGMKLTKIHKVLKCNQCDWLKNYIDFNTEKKKKMLLLVLEKTFLSWWLIVSMVKQWKN